MCYKHLAFFVWVQRGGGASCTSGSWSEREDEWISNFKLKLQVIWPSTSLVSARGTWYGPECISRYKCTEFHVWYVCVMLIWPSGSCRKNRARSGRGSWFSLVQFTDLEETLQWRNIPRLDAPRVSARGYYVPSLAADNLLSTCRVPFKHAPERNFASLQRCT